MQKIKLYIIGLALAALSFGLGLAVFSNSLGPDRSGNVILFYFLAAVFTFSLLTLAGFFIRRRFGQRELLNHYLSQSVRQGIWFTLLIILSLFLLSKGMFSWLSGGLLVLTLFFLESYLLTKNKTQ
ncbi:MAG: hypothetical protein ABI643_02235 [Candidatus Doudnabacteria bacterium]